jgi:hypothetical protein
MANKKIKLDPSKWVIDENNMINFRYRIVTDDLNIKSASSSVYSIEAPALLNDVFSSIVSNISSESIQETTRITVNWTTKPQYDGMRYFIYVQTPDDAAPVYNKTITETSFSYVVDNNDPASEGEYVITVTLPSTKKVVNTHATLFSKTITI